MNQAGWRLFATDRQAHVPLTSHFFLHLFTFYFLLFTFYFLLKRRPKAPFCDPGATRTPNQQNRNLSFYPLNYGTRSTPQKYNQKPVFTTNSVKLPDQSTYCDSSLMIYAKVFLFSQTYNQHKNYLN